MGPLTGLEICTGSQWGREGGREMMERSFPQIDGEVLLIASILQEVQLQAGQNADAEKGGIF